MSTLTLPAQINPPSFRKDRSVTLKFETRELTAEEFQTIMAFQNTEGWLLFSQNQISIEHVPKSEASLDLKSPSERMRSALYALYKQESQKMFVGTFESYYKGKMEQYIEHIISKLEPR